MSFFGAGTKHCITSTFSHYLYPFRVNLYIQFNQEGVRFLLTEGTGARVGEWDHNPALVSSRFLFLFFSSNNKCSRSDVPVKDFRKMRSQTKL